MESINFRLIQNVLLTPEQSIITCKIIKPLQKTKQSASHHQVLLIFIKKK